MRMRQVATKGKIQSGASGKIRKKKVSTMDRKKTLAVLPLMDEVCEKRVTRSQLILKSASSIPSEKEEHKKIESAHTNSREFAVKPEPFFSELETESTASETLQALSPAKNAMVNLHDVCNPLKSNLLDQTFDSAPSPLKASLTVNEKIECHHAMSGELAVKPEPFSPGLETESTASASGTLVSFSPIKNASVKVEDVCSPPKSNLLNQSFDSAPSPLTASLPVNPPQQEALTASVQTVDREEDLAPSPQSVHLTQSSSNQSLHHVTQNVFIEEDPLGDNNQPDDETFFDAVDTSISEYGKDLDLDNLITEIFTNNLDIPRPNLNKEATLSVSSLDVSIDKSDATTGDPLSSVGNKSNDSEMLEEPDLYSMETPSPKHGVHPSTSSSATVHDVVMSETAPEGNLGVDDEKQGSPKGACLHVVQNQTGIPDPLPDTCCNGDIAPKISLGLRAEKPFKDISKTTAMECNTENSEKEEAFCEDLKLSHSQFMDIDEKCELLKEISPDNLQATTASDCRLEKAVQDESRKPLPEQKPQLPTSLGFSVPPAPSMDWVQRTLESCQRLRMVTQEVSRLNAMVLRARRTLWPRQQPLQIPQQQPILASISNQNSRQQWSTPQHDHNQFGMPDLSHDPEWNIS